MSIAPSSLFFLYLFVFLAAVLSAWIMFLWQRRRAAASVRRFFICKACGGKIGAELPRVWIRCPHCNARHRLNQLQENN